MTTKTRTYKRKPRPKKEPSLWGICKWYGFSTTEKTIGGFIPDFIKKGRKLIIELEKDGRNSQERVNAFYRHGYKVLFIAESSLKDKKYITGMIKGFSA